MHRFERPEGCTLGHYLSEAMRMRWLSRKKRSSSLEIRGKENVVSCSQEKTVFKGQSELLQRRMCEVSLVSIPACKSSRNIKVSEQYKLHLITLENI